MDETLVKSSFLELLKLTVKCEQKHPTFQAPWYGWNLGRYGNRVTKKKLTPPKNPSHPSQFSLIWEASFPEKKILLKDQMGSCAWYILDYVKPDIQYH